MKKTLLQQKKQLIKQCPLKFIYNPAKQFKHRDLRSIAEGIAAFNREEPLSSKSWVQISILKHLEGMR